ncbi:hypothetical protein ACJMK2_011449 [Sinanodonta woodiana]|uniref:E3 ubiquitin-protein ligase CHFR n=1 Tax=Sinanodonta woodiana TaxID=1069815 RepID=A0ABD3V6U8_SINWO
MEIQETWALLVSLTDIDSEPIPIKKSKFVLGRAKDCDQCFPENKLVSSYHCYIERDEGSDENVWLCDTSTNGTLFNTTSKVTKGNRMKLKHGDEFYLVYKKGNEDVNVGFVFQSLQELEKEEDEEGTQEYSPNAQLDSTFIDEDCNLVEEDAECNQGTKRTPAESSPDDLSKKRLKMDENSMHSSETTGQQVIACKNLEQETELAASGQMETEKHDEKDEAEVNATPLVPQKEISEGDVKKPEPDMSLKDNMEENLLCTICQEIMHDCVSLQPCLHTFCAGCYSDWMKRSRNCPSCRKRVKRIHKNHIINNLIEAYLSERPEKKRPEEDLKQLDQKNEITNDMLYPSKKFPEVRDDDEEEEYEEYDDDEEDYNDTDEEEEDGTYYQLNLGSAAAGQIVFEATPPPDRMGFGSPFFGTTRPIKSLCRQCPGYKSFPDSGSGLFITPTVIHKVENFRAGNNSNNVNTITAGNNSNTIIDNDSTGIKAGNDSEAGGDNPSTSGGTKADDKASSSRDTEIEEASTSTAGGGENVKRTDEKVMVDAPPYTCSPLQTHVLCQCCLQPMPDRRADHYRDPGNIPAQQCHICFRIFCHSYWGCCKADCLGCLAKFKDLNFGRKCLDNILLDNMYESNVLKKYLDDHNMSVRDMLKSCLHKMEEGKYICMDQNRGVNSNSWLCYACGLRNLKDMVYQYRCDIPQDHLPGEVTARPDCHWGKNCRTQRNKLHHAANFNHICVQKRFMS